MLKRISHLLIALPNRILLSTYIKKFHKIGVNYHIGKNFSFKGCECISIGDDFYAESRLTLQAWKSYEGETLNNNPQILIGSNVSIMSDCHISCINKVEIGSGCLFGANVYVSDNFHGNSRGDELYIAPVKRELYCKGPVVIGKNVWIGRNVCIMPGVTIGEGAIIGANSVVTHDVPAFTVAAGVPARVIRKSNEE